MYGISDAIASASLIPGVDAFIDLASIPIDLARGDYISAGLDLLGAAPFAGEVADTARIARTADKAVDLKKIINKLPKMPSKLKSDGWKEITPMAMKKNTTSRTYIKDGLTIRFDKKKKGANGFAGKDHYHIFNPKSTGKHDLYLDKNGNLVPKKSKLSHIIP